MQPLTQIVAALALMLAAVGWMLFLIRRPEWHGTSRTREMVFALVILTVLLAWRAPALFSPAELNPDESQLAAGALTLAKDPVFWRSVDGTTSGPLNFYVLMPLLALDGLPVLFATRLTGLLLVWLSLVLSFALLRRAAGFPAAVFGFLPAWLFFSLTTDIDFVHYSSEHASLALIAAAGLLLWTSRSKTGVPRGWRWLLAGFCAGLLPWAKLQTAPIAAAFATGAVVFAMAAQNAPWTARLWAVLQFAASSLAPTGLFLAIVLGTGQFSHFLESYVLNNVAYATGGQAVRDALLGLWPALTLTWSFPSFLVAVTALTVVGVTLGLLKLRPPSGFFWGALVVVVAALVAILFARQSFNHYLLFLVLPGSWLAAAAAQSVWDLYPAHRHVFIPLALIPVLGFPTAARLLAAHPLAFTAMPEAETPLEVRIARVVSQFAGPGDTLAVWGWAPRIHVDSRLPQATRDGNCFRQIHPSTQRDAYYFPRFMEDIRRSRPAVFVDAVGPGLLFFSNRADASHENFPTLKEYVGRHYLLLTDAYGARVYARRDLIASRAAATRRVEQEIRALHSRGDTFAPLPASQQPRRWVYGREVIHLQTPSELTLTLDGDETEFFFDYGFEPGAYTQGDTNGAEITIEFAPPAGPPEIIFRRMLDPEASSGDRGLLRGRVRLPPSVPGTSLHIRTLPGPYNNNAWDWVFLTGPRFARTLVGEVAP
jgi:hypothetical protein